MYNGIKKDGKLFKAFYSFGGHKDSETVITIYAKSYDGLPEINGTEIKNDTDIITDYFEKDRMTVDLNNPDYKNILNAAIIAEVKTLNRIQRKYSKCMTEYCKNEIWNQQKRISKMQNLFDSI